MGVGGVHMEREGLNTLFPMDDLSIMGFLDVIPRIPALRRRLHGLSDSIAANNPDCVVCIDSKGFSERLMRTLRMTLGKSAPPLVQYVAPSVWAYRDGAVRAQKWASLADHLLLLFPFEGPSWQRAGASFTVVGDASSETYGQQRAMIGELPLERAKEHLGLSPIATVLGLLPGSRPAEVAKASRIVPPVVHELTQLMARRGATLQPLFISAPLVESSVRTQVAAKINGARVICNDGPETLYRSLAACDVALVASGTASVDTCLHEVPTVVFYPSSWVTGFIARRLAVVRSVSIPNIILDAHGDAAEIPEALFDQCTPATILGALRPLLFDGDGARACDVRQSQVSGLRRVRKVLLQAASERMPSARAADAVLELMNARSRKLA